MFGRRLRYFVVKIFLECMVDNLRLQLQRRFTAIFGAAEAT